MSLRALCQRRGLRQRALCRAIGISPATWYGWASGSRPIPAVRVAALCELLGCAPADLQARAPLKRGRKVAEPVFAPPTYQPVVWDEGDPCWICSQPVCVCHARRAAA